MLWQHLTTMVIDKIRKMSIKGVKLKSESFFSISPGVLELWRKNLRGADSAPSPPPPPGPDRVNVLPLAEEGYVLNKEEYRDAMVMRYKKQILGLPSKCARGSNFDTVHALDCKKGRFINSRHDQLRNLEAKMLSEVCQDIEVE